MVLPSKVMATGTPRALAEKPDPPKTTVVPKGPLEGEREREAAAWTGMELETERVIRSATSIARKRNRAPPLAARTLMTNPLAGQIVPAPCSSTQPRR
jgi:hypothetical protein